MGSVRPKRLPAAGGSPEDKVLGSGSPTLLPATRKRTKKRGENVTNQPRGKYNTTIHRGKGDGKLTRHVCWVEKEAPGTTAMKFSNVPFLLH